MHSIKYKQTYQIYYKAYNWSNKQTTYVQIGLEV